MTPISEAGRRSAIGALGGVLYVGGLLSSGLSTNDCVLLDVVGAERGDDARDAADADDAAEPAAVAPADHGRIDALTGLWIPDPDPPLPLP